jgi:AAA domain
VALRAGGALQAAAHNGGLAESPELADRVRGLPEQSTGPGTFRLDPLTAPNLIVGDTGAGKTSLMAQLIAAALTGCEALGYQGAGAGPAMIVDLEQGLCSVKRALREARLDRRTDLLYVHVPDGLRSTRTRSRSLLAQPQPRPPDPLVEQNPETTSRCSDSIAA